MTSKTLLANTVIDITIIICVTIAAISLNNWGLLWFYLLTLISGVIPIKKDNNNKTENEEN